LQESRQPGFTLIEMSIVLVTIGLLVGGIMVGQNLGAAANVRATITQIEKYNTAVNTFRGKYNELPGDISASLVKQLGFTTVPVRAGTQARGDGNGVIQGWDYGSSTEYDWNQTGETAFFWEDISANSPLIEGSFSTAQDAEPSASITNINTYLPAAKVGNGNYINVWSESGINYFVLTLVTTISQGGAFGGYPGLTAAQAQSIDSKVDDGFPKQGNVTIFYGSSAAGGYGESPHAVSGSATTCYDYRGNSGTNPPQYSIEIGNGNNVHCALSFQFQ
jgi:prepilin-type N-terminal cleavage/methylation domain-containing protein